MVKASLSRTHLLLGDDAMARMASTRVILIGCGGVGSWCAEGLVRSGISHITIVDSDRVCPTNINRQLMATSRTVGRPKVEVLRERLLEINPDAEITALAKTFSEESSGEFHLETYDYIIDAIDSLKDKIALILKATSTPAIFFSSMGAAVKVDPTKIRVAEFWDVRGCPMGFALRKKIRRGGVLPSKKFLCVYDDEVLDNLGEMSCRDVAFEGELPSKKVINGTTAHITAIFGFTLSGLVIKDIYQKSIDK
ncbi:MAG: tRNA threonylcarbamoyladenosine dehydratase [Bacteroidales bacterium]|nr:tRNA threonylcarbamoyladenosine dehydratase [Bacteroidales bacterium]